MQNDFSKFINSIKFQMYNKKDIITALEFYADNSKNISNKDYNNIFLLYSIL